MLSLFSILYFQINVDVSSVLFSLPPLNYFQTALVRLIDAYPLSGLDQNGVAELFLQLLVSFNITNEAKKKVP